MVLQVSGLNVTYRGGIAAVRGVGFAVERGEVLGIAGESGSGKTALSLAVMGLPPPGARVTGSVRLAGRELLGAADAELARIRGNDIAMVFQDPLSSLTPVYPVGDQVAETLRAHAGSTRRAARARAVELLERVGVPDPGRSARAYPHELSGGMRQRAMIAMALANDPLVVIADEPTTALDMTVQAEVLDVLRAATDAAGAAMVLVTHDLGVIAALADRVMVMRGGRAVEQGPVDDVYHRPRHPYTAVLVGLPSVPTGPLAVPPPRSPSGNASPLPPETPSCRATGTVAARAETVLEVSRLVRHFPVHTGRIWRRRAGMVRAVDGISLDVRQGETLGLVGESGCGKTTTLMEILRLDAPQRGRVTVLGRDTGSLTAAERRRLRRDVQAVLQDPLASLDPRMPVSDLVAEPLTAHGRPSGEIADRVRELLALVGLEPPLAARHPGGLSGGQLQRVCIARALALEPRLVLLDEPVSALDVSVRAGVLDLLADLQARLGLAYLVVSHDLDVVRRLADRVAVMYGGRIVEIGSVVSVYVSPAHPYTRALLSATPVADPRAARDRRGTRPLPAGGPSPVALPPGCRFRARCPVYAELAAGPRDRCDRRDPALREAGGGPAADHRVACHHANRHGETEDGGV